MDSTGWHAMHRAAKADIPLRGPDGRYNRVEQVSPVQSAYHHDFTMGFTPNPGTRQSDDSALDQAQYDGRPTPPPPLPPPQHVRMRSLSVSPAPTETPLASITRSLNGASSVPTQLLRTLSAVERSLNLRVERMNPHLQFMVGPLLRFDTIEEGIWKGAAMIVTADAGSYYDPNPILKCSFDPTIPAPNFTSPSITPSNSSLRARSMSQPDGINIGARMKRFRSSFDGGYNPHLNSTVPSQGYSSWQESPNYVGEDLRSLTFSGQEIWVYCGDGGTYTFWRFMIEIPLGPNEMKVAYCINNGPETEFWVPATNQNMRVAAYSCNGFSAGVNPDDFRGPGFQTGYDPVWIDLLKTHYQEPFHLLMGGGDQLYCDKVTREPELQDWITQHKPELKLAYALTEEIEFAIDRYYFSHYCQTFRSGAFAKANSGIPMLNMCDDHDLIDGFGSYPDDLQRSPVFRTIGARGYFFFLLFQCFINPELDGLDDGRGKHPFRSVIIGEEGPYIPFPSHSILSNLGPQMWTLMLDCRAERRKDQVCSDGEYRKVFDRLRYLPQGVEQLIIQSGIPIAYPRLSFLETALETNMNPLVYLGRNGSLAKSGFVNMFNSDPELLDDLNDHWTSQGHKRERNWLIERLQNFAKGKCIRISFVTGDVHCAAVGVFKTLSKGKKATAISSELDHRYMVDVTTSAIVNTPPPNAVLALVNSRATKTHTTMHKQETDEEMLPLFEKDTDGSARQMKYIMGRRNWCIAKWEQPTRSLLYDIRVEKEKGGGETVGYSVTSPPPMWRPDVGFADLHI